MHDTADYFSRNGFEVDLGPDAMLRPDALGYFLTTAKNRA
jgi:hypothetical protein